MQLLLTLLLLHATAGESPSLAADPVPFHWTLSPKGDGSPAIENSAFAPASAGGGLILNGREDSLLLAERAAALLAQLPRNTLTLSAWVAIERPLRWGGIISCVQDNGDFEKGFVLGYNEESFTFGLSTTGADDGNGKLTYLRGQTPWRAGRWHHVVATFDGVTMRLYVDGVLDATSTEQSGEVLYDADAPLILGAYRDLNEFFPLDGRLLEAGISPEVSSEAMVRATFEKSRARTTLDPWTDLEFGFLVDPYLTWPTENAMSILFESTFSSTAKVTWRRDDEDPADARTVASPAESGLHEFRLEDLIPDQKYFYRVEIESVTGAKKASPLLSFRTAASADHAFTFVVIGDTQTHGEVAKRVSDLAYIHRPNFALHAGDLVDTGSAKSDWTDTFFPSMQPLIGRVPLMPVLGNHEQDAAHYYRYMSLPEPERWYSFRYGNAEFFMIDGNRSLADQSAQLTWLETTLAASTATWRFAILHQPPYTSDSNDYGDTHRGTSFRGDKNVRNIVRLLEEHDIDICFSGHVHDYERTFPIRGGRVLAYEEGGVIYVTAAGGGGSLEDFDPTNTWFGHKKSRTHHFVYVAIHGNRLEFQAIDDQGRLFDAMALKKRP